MWNLPWDTQRPFIKALREPHAQTLIYTFIGFKRAVMYLNTMTGQDVRHIIAQAQEVDIFRINKTEQNSRETPGFVKCQQMKPTHNL